MFRGGLYAGKLYIGRLFGITGQAPPVSADVPTYYGGSRNDWREEVARQRERERRERERRLRIIKDDNELLEILPAIMGIIDAYS